MIFGRKKGDEKKTEREKVEERREEILKQGRKFKYPLQYSKSRMIILTVVIILLAGAAMAGLGWFSLYKAQSTGEILYRLTTVLPVPVAKVAGEPVRYSDYLLIYRSSVTPVERQGQMTGDNAGDVEAMKAHYKRMALTDAESYTYALKLAREYGIEVSNADIDAEIASHRKVGGVERSEESFEKILNDNFGLSMREYRRLIYLTLMRAKVAEKIDTVANDTVKEVEKKIAAGQTDLRVISEELGERVRYEETGGLVDKMNVDGGRAGVAMTLNDGEVSPKFLSSNGDGYYFVKLISKTESAVNYTSIMVPLEQFDAEVDTLWDNGEIVEYIELSDKE